MKRRTLLLPCLIAALYVAWPYASLLKLRQDLRNHDVAALRGDIDWASVRGGLKQDVLDSLEGKPVATKVSDVTGDDLPPFGASFAANMAGNAVDQQVTPQRLADAFSSVAPGGAHAPQPTVQTARFDGLTHFIVKVSATGTPISLTLALERQGWQIGWKVTHVCLPAGLMAQSETHTS
jgi:hypothetical protein